MVVRFSENVGTSGNNQFTGANLNIYFGLGGNDTFTAQAGLPNSATFFGGNGDDTYRAGLNSSIIVSDTGGNDRIIATGIRAYGSNSFGAEIDGRHLLITDTSTSQSVIILDWRDPARRIETFQLGDGTYTYDFVVNNVYNGDGFLGSYTWEQALEGADADFSASEARELINYYYARDAALAAPVTAPPPPPSNNDISADINTSGTLQVGSSLSSEISGASDVDWIKVTLTAGSQYTIDVKGAATDDGTLADPYVVLRDANGTYLSQDDNNGDGANGRIVFTPSTSGNYFVEARSFATNPSGTYTVGLSQTSGGGGTTPPTTEDLSATTSTAGSVTVGSSFSSDLSTASDIDWVKVTLVAGTQYTFSVNGSSSTDGTLADPYLVLRDSNGIFIAQDDDSGTGTNAQLTYRPTATGAFYVEARTFNPSSSGTYKVNISQVGSDNTGGNSGSGLGVADIPGNNTTNAKIQLGQSFISETVLSGDLDWVTVNLTAGTQYTFEMKGAATNSGTLSDPFLVLRNSNGVFVAQDDDSGDGLNARISYKPTISGAYYLEARSFGTVGTGSYTLTASAGAPGASTEIEKQQKDMAVITALPASSLCTSDVLALSPATNDDEFVLITAPSTTSLRNGFESPLVIKLGGSSAVDQLHSAIACESFPSVRYPSSGLANVIGMAS